MEYRKHESLFNHQSAIWKKTNQRDDSEIFWQKIHHLLVRLMFNIVRKQQRTAQYDK